MRRGRTEGMLIIGVWALIGSLLPFRSNAFGNPHSRARTTDNPNTVPLKTCVARDGLGNSIDEDAPYTSRRKFVVGSIAASFFIGPDTSRAAAAGTDGTDAASSNSIAFRTGAYGREEYTNSIVASRDTNISPKEVYDSIQSQYIRYPLEKMREAGNQRTARALDVGSGAGVSTQVLWDIGYHRIDAIDWSGKAWERFVVEDDAGQCPESVEFYELDDERYVDFWRSHGSNQFDTIVFNFGINERKAVQFAKELLEPQNGRLLAPVNVENDYWLKQVYKVYDGRGKVVEVLGQDIGAWSVQFQPDVTQDTCQGIWCAQFNGFQKKR